MTAPDQGLSHSGEFADPSREAAFQQERLAETLRFARLVFLAAIGLNTLFLLSDARFFGEPYFAVAVTARLWIVLSAVAAYLLLRRAETFPRIERVVVAWQALASIAAAVLVSPGTDAALFVLFLIPVIFYLCMVSSFRWRVAGGIWSSALMTVGYLQGWPPSAPALVFGLITLNAVLSLVVSRTNRLGRMEWAAIRAERQAKEALAQSKQTLERMFMAVPIPLVLSLKGEGRIIKANPAAWKLYGDSRSLHGVATEEIFVNAGDRQRLLATIERQGLVEGFETSVHLADGSIRHMLLAAAQVEIDGVSGIVTGAVDITSRKQMETYLERLATTDPLTGLLNRIRFFSLARAEIQRADRYARPLALAMVDVDNFKTVNDTHGHESGDQVLRAFAELCRATLRHQDIVARLGGEEFALLLPETNRDRALLLAERLRAQAEHLEMPDKRPAPRITISIGVAEVYAGESEPDAALARADQALYAAKRAGRNRVMAYQVAEL